MVCLFSAEVATDIFRIRFHSENLQSWRSNEEYCTVRTNYGRHMISSPIYILQYSLPQILHTFFTIQVCNLIAERFTDTRRYQSAYVALQEDLLAWLHFTICLCANTFIWNLEEMVLAQIKKWRYCLLFKKALAQDVSKWSVQSKSTFSVSFKSAKWVAIDGAKIQESSTGVCQIECCKYIWIWKHCPQLKCE